MLATPTIEISDGRRGLHNSLSIPMGKHRGFARHTRGFYITMDEDGDEYTLESLHLLPENDKRGLIHSKEYSPIHPRSISLMCNEGGSDSECIQFQCDTEKVVDYKRGKQCPVVVPLYHSHVLWSYEPRISIDKDGRICLTLASVGPHLSVPDGKGKDPKNVPPGLRFPPVLEASVAIRNANGDVTATFDLQLSSDGSLVLLKQFTLAEFRALTVDGKLLLRLRITVPRAYFSLSSVIDLTERPAAPSTAASTVSPKILRADRERDLCRRALALDVRNPTSSSMVELLRLLDFIWEMPYGHYPVAKRVAVGVLADMMHLGPYTSTHDFVQDMLLPSFHESRINPTNLLTILVSLAIHLNTIPCVRKMSVTVPESGPKPRDANTNGNSVEKEAEQTSTVRK